MMSSQVMIHEFILKGRFPEMRMDPTTKWTFSDLGTPRPGKVIFEGTEEQADAFHAEVIGFHETYYKVIGVKSHIPAEYDRRDKFIYKAK